MKIAIFSDCYLDLTGGIVSSINAQKSALEARGHTVYIFSTGYQRTEAELTRLARKKIFVVPSCRVFFKGLTPVSRRPKIIERWLIQKHPEIRDFDVFYVHYEAGCSIAGLRLARKLGVRSVQVMHGREDVGVSTIIPFGMRTLVAWMMNWLHARFIPHPIRIGRDDYLADTIAKAKMWTLMVNHANVADVVATPSVHFKKKLAHYGVTRLIHVIPNGYPDKKLRSQIKTKELRAGETLKIIWHSRVSPEKRIMPFLKALTIVDGEWTMDVYGGGTELTRAKRYASRHKLPIKFHGDTPFNVVQEAICKAHLDVLVSYNCDTFGMTLIEAEACGVPVFFCDPDMKEVVPDGSYVLSIGESPREMALALNKLLAHPEQIAKMSRVMIKHRTEILASKQMDKLQDLLEMV